MDSSLCKAQAGVGGSALAGEPSYAHLVLLVLQFAVLCSLPAGKTGIDQVHANILPP